MKQVTDGKGFWMKKYSYPSRIHTYHTWKGSTVVRSPFYELFKFIFPLTPRFDYIGDVIGNLIAVYHSVLHRNVVAEELDVLYTVCGILESDENTLIFR
jgi:hypothetical protein